MFSPSDSCSLCHVDLDNFIAIQRISPTIVAELSEGYDQYEGQDNDLIEEAKPYETPREEAVEVADEQDRQLCFYCRIKTQEEWKQRNNIPMYLGHSEIEPNEETNATNLPMGKLTNEQRAALVDLLEDYKHLFAWNLTQLG